MSVFPSQLMIGRIYILSYSTVFEFLLDKNLSSSYERKLFIIYHDVISKSNMLLKDTFVDVYVFNNTFENASTNKYYGQFFNSGNLVNAEDLEKHITPKTKALLIGYPNNPTGTILEYDELLAIANFAQKHNLIVISDEIYGDLTYGERKHICFSALPDMKERSIILNGFSKAYAMTGWRLGYALAPKPVIDAMNKIHQYTMICAPITAQIAGLEAIRNGQKHMKKMVAEYDRRRRLIYEGFTSMGLKCFEPKGAFYIFPDISSTGLSSEEFAEQLLLRQHVAVVPGTAFGECGKGFIRASYATSVDNISGALARIKNFLDNL